MTAFVLDERVERDARALDRLRSEAIGWLGTNGRDGFPHAVPVWFLWHDDAVIVFVQPGSAKAKNLRADARALFHLEAGDDGEQMHVLQGTVEISHADAASWISRIGEAYLGKYATGIAGLGSTPERMWADYSMVVVFRPHKLIAW
ncbi:PPOX class probable F420-dependent enzyme [Microbacterium terrae]|uniref:Pyridoxamine 5'-phosphate oxidase n=1 Tax=Microbacterium terrae TaxID=69369 RepID=A0A0M2HBT7_9MICO|nr:pyridoxamine 5'-phosphate oxidase family protein [Microbacterium terrae]KJL44041.1 Pyridoxamine 5'-phosphate oxidase [Microbacterium terrae]MBP1079424.1 PPOX class probable F420-dependent enzyme [Microbacterium terrae]GLJ98824.1 hypothetical protein GCM10017594_20210 [Microbacterium terrae]